MAALTCLGTHDTPKRVPVPVGESQSVIISILRIKKRIDEAFEAINSTTPRLDTFESQQRSTNEKIEEINRKYEVALARIDYLGRRLKDRERLVDVLEGTLQRVQADREADQTKLEQLQKQGQTVVRRLEGLEIQDEALNGRLNMAELAAAKADDAVRGLEDRMEQKIRAAIENKFGKSSSVDIQPGNVSTIIDDSKGNGNHPRNADTSPQGPFQGILDITPPSSQLTEPSTLHPPELVDSIPESLAPLPVTETPGTSAQPSANTQYSTHWWHDVAQDLLQTERDQRDDDGRGLVTRGRSCTPPSRPAKCFSQSTTVASTPSMSERGGPVSLGDGLTEDRQMTCVSPKPSATQVAEPKVSPAQPLSPLIRSISPILTSAPAPSAHLLQTNAPTTSSKLPLQTTITSLEPPSSPLSIRSESDRNDKAVASQWDNHPAPTSTSDLESDLSPALSVTSPLSHSALLQRVGSPPTPSKSSGGGSFVAECSQTGGHLLVQDSVGLPTTPINSIDSSAISDPPLQLQGATLAFAPSQLEHGADEESLTVHLGVPDPAPVHLAGPATTVQDEFLPSESTSLIKTRKKTAQERQYRAPIWTRSMKRKTKGEGEIGTNGKRAKR